ncbi:glycosyltransferase family 4 protein [Natronolimnobius sp. AArcel1]|uniref:glycosyltransferase n=1 Tax=Natronolimnobius sp. AArcel1 TaxID=1679093 RepID=UPI0013EA1A52|nr:glycosyltransferase [Natronolimnobius sp. AArcel1]NGM70441.1 glycosyltransferase family 4 protein [Natronolimnobius sp. AArcel1]
MKVLQLVTSPRPFFEQQVTALEERGVECTVLAVPGSYDGDSSRSPLEYLRYYPQILKAVRTMEFDLVHANYGLVVPFAFTQPTRPLVTTLWGTDLMSNRTWLRSMSRFGARYTDATIVPSPAMSDALETDHELIPFGVDTELFRPIPQAEARERIGWETDRPIALFPYDRTRSVKDFPRATRLVDEAETDLDIRPISGVDHATMPYYMNASDVLLLTSRRESGPMVIKEAAACQLPVVSTDVGFVRETLADVDNCVVSDADAELIAGLERIISGSGRTNGRDVIDDLSLEEMGDQLLEVYQTVLERRAGGEPDEANERHHQTEVDHGV